MNTILVRCPICERLAKVPQDTAGKNVRCTGCRRTFLIPHGTADLTIEWGPAAAGHRVPLRPGRRVTIGRTKDNTVSLPGALVSRRHAILDWNVSEWRLRDAGSTNGTFVNGQRIREVGLTDGSRIVIGEFALRLAVAGTGPTDFDTALDAMAVDETRAGMAAIVEPYEGGVLAGDSRAETAVGQTVIGGPVEEQPTALKPRRRSLLEQWPVVAGLAALVVLLVLLLFFMLS